jgi:hypothetical protein
MRDYSGTERGELIEEIYRKEAEIERLEEVLRGVGAGNPDVCHRLRTSRVDGTRASRASMHFETSLADEARHGPPCGDHDLGEPSRARRR